MGRLSYWRLRGCLSPWLLSNVIYSLLFVWSRPFIVFFFFFQAEDGIRDLIVTGVQTCALPILRLELVEPAVSLLQLALQLDRLAVTEAGRSLEVGRPLGPLRLLAHLFQLLLERSEERRVGEEGRSRWWPYH